MRLAFCNATHIWSGVKTWTIEFATAMQDMGHDIFLYGRPGLFIERAQSKGLNAIPANFGPDFNLVSIAWFYKEFHDKNIEAVQVNISKDLRTAGIAARLSNLPLIQRIGLPEDMKHSLKVRMLHRFLQAHYLCPCHYIRDGFISIQPNISIQDTSVIHSAKTPSKTIPTLPGTSLRLVSSSRVTSSKGHFELAQTLGVLKTEGFNFHWDIVGTGDAVPELLNLCQQLGLEEDVTFHGFSQNVNAILAQADVFILSSYVEGLPNTLLEGMANGLVLVARDVGGVQECWPEALPDLLVPFEGWEAKQNWLNYTPKNPAQDLPLYTPLRKVFSTPATELLGWKKLVLKHCQDNFSLQVQAKKLETFFQEQINKSVR